MPHNLMNIQNLYNLVKIELQKLVYFSAGSEEKGLLL